MDGEWRLSDVEFDVVWRELGFGAAPYPLEMQSPGTSHDERTRIAGEVGAELAARGLTGVDSGPRRELTDALTLLAGSEVLIDGRLVLADDIRLAAGRAGDRAAMVLQRRDRVIVRALAGPRLSSALAALLPVTPPAAGQPLNLPHTALRQALRQLGEGGGGWEFEQALKAAGVRGQEARWLMSLATVGPRAAAAQFGVTLRHRLDGHWDGSERRAGFVSWYATGDGAVVIHRPSGSDWVTVAPGDVSRLITRLDDLAAQAAGTS